MILSSPSYDRVLCVSSQELRFAALISLGQRVTERENPVWVCRCVCVCVRVEIGCLTCWRT